MLHQDDSAAVALSRPELMELLRQCSKRLGGYIDACDWKNAESAIEERNDLLRALAANLNRETQDETQPEPAVEAKQFLAEIQEENNEYISDLSEKIRQHREHLRELRMGRTTIRQYKQNKAINPRFLNTVG